MAEGFCTAEALREQRKRLQKRQEETKQLIVLIDRMLEAETKGTAMTNEELFDGFNPEEHLAEAKQRWGDTPAYKESARRTKQYDQETWKTIHAEAEQADTRHGHRLARAHTIQSRGPRWTSPSATACTSTSGSIPAVNRCTQGSATCT